MVTLSTKRHAVGSGNKKLFHGSDMVIQDIDVSRGKDFKDFGKGFYTTDRPKVAEKWARKTAEIHRDAISMTVHSTSLKLPYAIVNQYIATDLLNGLNVIKFDNCDMDWLNFIIYNRTHAGVTHDYDIVIGPIADGDTKIIIKEYMHGDYGDPSLKKTKMKALRMITRHNIGLQIFIGTNRAAARLHLEGWYRA